jgi:heme exporter protein D
MNLADFFSMDGRAFYVWGSFGALAIGVLIEVLVLRARANSIHAEIEEDALAALTQEQK